MNFMTCERSERIMAGRRQPRTRNFVSSTGHAFKKSATVPIRRGGDQDFYKKL